MIAELTINNDVVVVSAIILLLLAGLAVGLYKARAAGSRHRDRNNDAVMASNRFVESLMDQPTREEQEKVMRELIAELWSGAYGYKEMEEILPEQLAAHKITDEQWIEFLNVRRPVERSLEQVGAGGILLKDLAEYHGLPQQGLLELLRVIGAVNGEDGRFRLAGELAGSAARRFAGITVLDMRSPVQKLLEQAGAAGLSLEDLAGHLGHPPQKVLKRLQTIDALKGEDDRFRLPNRMPAETARAFAKNTVPALIRTLGDSDDRVRGNAARKLGEIGAREAVAALTHALNDQNWQVRVEVALALSRIGPEAQQAASALKKALSDEHEFVRYVAGIALKHILTNEEPSGDR